MLGSYKAWKLEGFDAILFFLHSSFPVTQPSSIPLGLR